ncbi:hypothetical protein EXIGLDRAFT_42937 [Exidia glandulosa HHB12029]|uniref:F-box domain-containing protein n=1 Tax=Exidia glandulosa HHB12029 TaxID=1314781 RepID=A0A165IJB9_EXIGL|nr:hypothetical protein EXIGLDRAFT_42937 [Exidia glandulosa HHB12029]
MAAPGSPLAHDHGQRAMLSSAFGPTPSLSLPSDFDYSRFVLPELLLDVFDYLPQRDLLSVSGVCRRWRSLALSHPNLFYHLALNVDVARADVWKTLNTFCAGLLYLRTRNRRASVAVDWSRLSGVTDTVDRIAIIKSESSLSSSSVTLAVRIVMEAIGDSLAILNKISLTFGAPPDFIFPNTVFPFLSCASAPQLDKFALTVFAPLMDDPIVLSPSLFKGVAPKLRDVTLRGVCLDCQSHPALAAASVVDLDLVKLWGSLSSCFPNVHELKMRHLSMFTTIHSLIGTLRNLAFGFSLGMADMGVVLKPFARVPRTLITVNASINGSSGDLTLASFFGAPHEPELYIQLLGNSVDMVQLAVSDKHADAEREAKFARIFAFTGFNDAALRGILGKTLRPLTRRIVNVVVAEALLELLPEFFDSLPALESLHVEWSPEASPAPLSSSFPNLNASGTRVHVPKLRHLQLIASSYTGNPLLRVEVPAERLRRVLRPQGSLLQDYVGVKLKQFLVQDEMTGDFAAVDSDKEYRAACVGHDAHGHVCTIMYSTGPNAGGFPVGHFGAQSFM